MKFVGKNIINIMEVVLDTSIFLYLGIILLFTKGFGMLTRRAHMPQVIGALVAGILLGPSALNLIPFNEIMEVLAEIGVIIIMFNAGLETNFSDMKKNFKSSVSIGVIEVVFCLVSGIIFAYGFGMKSMNAIFIGVLLTATSLGITVEALNEMGKVRTPVGSAVLGLSVVDDIIGIILLTVVLNLSTATSFSFITVVLLLLKIVSFFIVAFVGGLLVQKAFINMYQTSGNTRRVTIVALAFCFIMSWLAEQFQLADITGAYIAGLILCNIKSAEYIEHKTTVLSYLLFSPIFFASVGLKTELSGMTKEILIFAIGFMALSFGTKVIGNFVGAKICKYSTNVALGIGLGMVCRGEVTLIMANKGIEANILDEALFPAIILMVIFTALITPLLLLLYFNKIDNSVQEE